MELILEHCIVNYSFNSSIWKQKGNASADLRWNITGQGLF